MKKFLLIAFLFVDVALIGGATYVLFTYVQKRLPLARPAAVAKRTPGPEEGTTSTSTVKLGSGLTPSGSATDPAVRKILFTYRNSKVKQVSIRADFTGWKAEPMQKSEDNTKWTYMAHLTPGEYAYCFTVGDKIINDPANKRTKVIGRTTVSAIVVEALQAKQ
jgi:1,4-alpha-glucan branching enzyme